MRILELRTDLATWAASKPFVKRAWIFGSRARQQEKADSDLDIAIELDLSAAEGVDESGGIATWMFETGTWPDELAKLIPLCN
jgi:predicted nucleotidyltransferase